MKSTAKRESKLSRCLKAPIRVLCKARDLYVNSLTGCAGRLNYDTVMGCPVGVVSTLPRSFSNTSSRASEDEDLRELIRAASQRNLVDKLGITNTNVQPKGSKGVVPRSFSVGIGRIDEDKPCDFKEDFKVSSDVLYPRSRSYAVSKRRSGIYS
eukprot:TRINITY_DN16149_c0_g1_i1.p1 TRINITY_DN16149_c0_g1~~TRINITY_DN16149_c0_g1_i1.p1  ORF type:complete len:154 (+),score=14.88 TRINITY_DN16149_c0_g1_i1:149-610(+)